jgi:hypothetical protein
MGGDEAVHARIRQDVLQELDDEYKGTYTGKQIKGELYDLHTKCIEMIKEKYMKTTNVIEIVKGAVTLNAEQKKKLSDAIAVGRIMSTVNDGYFQDSEVVNKFLEVVKKNNNTGENFKAYIGGHGTDNEKALCAKGILIVWALYTQKPTQTERFGICRGCGKLRNATYGKEDGIRRTVKTTRSVVHHGHGPDRK